jgi:23S rRNA (cytosine1962-C5)-methyltransferase
MRIFGPDDSFFTPMIATVHLLPDRDRSLQRRHPWIFDGAIAALGGSPESGETVLVCAADGRPLGHGAFSPRSQIAVRMWSFDPHEGIDEGFFRRRIAHAIAARKALPEAASTNAMRLIHAESDGLPGLVVDRYGDYLVCQITGAGAEYHGECLVDLLSELAPCAGIFERSDVDSREKEGLAPQVGVLAGDPPPPTVLVQEGPCRYAVDIQKGQKTGFYLDQRDNRALLPAYSAGREVLNCFSYTGAFGLSALVGGAKSVEQLDSSGTALAAARANAELSGLPADRITYVEANAFAMLREYRQEGRAFDLIILDPPKLATNLTQVKQASRAYKDANLFAMKCLRPGGLLFTFSCSGNVPADLFQKIVADAALDAGRNGVLLRRLGQAADHPVALQFPEGAYLKGLLVRVD